MSRSLSLGVLASAALAAIVVALNTSGTHRCGKGSAGEKPDRTAPVRVGRDDDDHDQGRGEEAGTEAVLLRGRRQGPEDADAWQAAPAAPPEQQGRGGRRGGGGDQRGRSSRTRSKS